jgi:hypothetical protein
MFDMPIFAELSLAELAEFWNAEVVGAVADAKPVKRFPSKADAERRITQAFMALPEEAPKAPKASAEKRSQAEGVAASWLRPEVAAKRKQRSAVVVDGQPFTSVKKAFEALDLPLKVHIRFRMDLKAAGALTEFGHSWEIVPLNY